MPQQTEFLVIDVDTGIDDALALLYACAEPTKQPPTKKRAAKEIVIGGRVPKSYRIAKTRIETRSVSAHFPAEPVHAFRVLAASEDKDVQQLLAEAINLLFERKGVKARIPVFSGRRTRAHSGA